jgi:hypothetical protein
MNTCRHNAGETKRGPELEDGKEITGWCEKEGDYPRFFDRVLRIQVSFSSLTVQSRKCRATTSTCEEANIP